MNKVFKCYENGIIALAKRGILCNGLLKFNSILQNKDNGILIAGKYNFVKIVKSIEIAGNRKAGIRVIEEAMPSILHNVIRYNFG